MQFTPDLMPGDVTGSLVYDARTAEFSFRAGPVFTNLLLADEINRTPPKTQASLLEAMEERQVSVDGTPRPLPDPFLVIATQNPVEYEGTYPLPEAQLDRFLLKLLLPLPERDEEIEVLARHAAGFDPRDLAGGGRAARRRRRRCSPAPGPRWPACRWRPRCSATRSTCAARRGTSPSLSLGVSPRGATALLATSRAWAWLSGRGYVTPDDVKALAHPTLRHRVQLRAEAELEGVTHGERARHRAGLRARPALSRGRHLARGPSSPRSACRRCSSCPSPAPCCCGRCVVVVACAVDVALAASPRQVAACGGTSRRPSG